MCSGEFTAVNVANEFRLEFGETGNNANFGWEIYAKFIKETEIEFDLIRRNLFSNIDVCFIAKLAIQLKFK